MTMSKCPVCEHERDLTHSVHMKTMVCTECFEWGYTHPKALDDLVTAIESGWGLALSHLSRPRWAVTQGRRSAVSWRSQIR